MRRSFFGGGVGRRAVGLLPNCKAAGRRAGRRRRGTRHRARASGLEFPGRPAARRGAATGLGLRLRCRLCRRGPRLHARASGLEFPGQPAAGRGAAAGLGLRPDVVLRSPLALVPSSSSTTSSELKAPPAYRTWCLSPRKTLFLRHQAPRLWRRLGFRLVGRGASLPAKPCSFVVEHHVFQAQGAAGIPDVVPLSPQNLVPSSSSTTSSELKAPVRPTAGFASKK